VGHASSSFFPCVLFSFLLSIFYCKYVCLTYFLQFSASLLSFPFPVKFPCQVSRASSLKDILGNENTEEVSNAIGAFVPSSQKEAFRQMLINTFTSYDKDGDGSLSRSSLASFPPSSPFFFSFPHSFFLCLIFNTLFRVLIITVSYQGRRDPIFSVSSRLTPFAGRSSSNTRRTRFQRTWQLTRWKCSPSWTSMPTESSRKTSSSRPT